MTNLVLEKLRLEFQVPRCILYMIYCFDAHLGRDKLPKQKFTEPRISIAGSNVTNGNNDITVMNRIDVNIYGMQHYRTLHQN